MNIIYKIDKFLLEKNNDPFPYDENEFEKIRNKFEKDLKSKGFVVYKINKSIFKKMVQEFDISVSTLKPALKGLFSGRNYFEIDVKITKDSILVDGYNFKAYKLANIPNTIKKVFKFIGDVK